MSAGDWVWPDDNADRLLASNRIRRYQAYLALGLANADASIREDVLGDPIGFALWAWRQAIPPTMSPGYVDWRDPIDTVRILCQWEGAAIAELEVRVPPPVLPRPGAAAGLTPTSPAATGLSSGWATLRIRLAELVVPAPGPQADLDQILASAKQLVAQTCRTINDEAHEPLADLSRLWTPAARQPSHVTNRNEPRGAPLR